jgi:hypothetical protein
VSTLIAVYNSDGCVGRCDAKCYDAAHPDCDCICGGKNHGAGRVQAEANTRELGEQWVERYAAEKGVKVSEVVGDLLQPALFNVEPADYERRATQ